MRPEAPEEIAERAKNLYTIIVNGELGDDAQGVAMRVEIIGELEKITKKQFRNTAEFHREVSAFLARKSRVKETAGTRLQRARKKAGMTIRALAAVFNVTKMTVIRWEQNKHPLPPSVIEWMEKRL